jgi:hypothetical protein
MHGSGGLQGCVRHTHFPPTCSAGQFPSSIIITHCWRLQTCSEFAVISEQMGCRFKPEVDHYRSDVSQRWGSKHRARPCTVPISSRAADAFKLRSMDLRDPSSSFKMYAHRRRHRMVALDHTWLITLIIRLDASFSRGQDEQSGKPVSTVRRLAQCMISRYQDTASPGISPGMRHECLGQ